MLLLDAQFFPSMLNYNFRNQCSHYVIYCINIMGKSKMEYNCVTQSDVFINGKTNIPLFHAIISNSESLLYTCMIRKNKLILLTKAVWILSTSRRLLRNCFSICFVASSFIVFISSRKSMVHFNVFVNSKLPSSATLTLCTNCSLSFVQNWFMKFDKKGTTMRRLTHKPLITWKHWK